MMSHTSKSQVCNVRAGTVIKGKWYHNRYQIIKTLGYGATGYVYLAKSKQGLVALKLSDNSMAITSEVNVLRHFSKVQGVNLGPSLIDVDDWVIPKISQKVSFYVMEYLEGEGFFEFIKRRGTEWNHVFYLQLLSDLHHLHEAGWVFGDLKPENLIVVGPPYHVKWLDVGGTTLQGRSIKEFTEFYDRGYWGGGSRRAEPSYDLFSVAMIMIQSAYTKRFSKKEGEPYQQLVQAVTEKKELEPLQSVILKALRGKYQSALEMRIDLMEKLSKGRKKPLVGSRIEKAVKNPKGGARSGLKGVLETVLIAAVLFLGYVIYLFGQIL